MNLEGFRQPRALLAWLTVLVLLAPATLRAHDVPVEQIVAVSVRLLDRALHLHLDVPLTAVTDAGLTLAADGTLPSEATSATLTPVATQVVRNLDIRDGAPIRPVSVAVVASADRRGLAIDVRLPVASLDGLSANLNAFQSRPLQPVVTELRVQRPDGATNRVRIDGPPQRVLFDPQVGDVVAQFMPLAARASIGWQDSILMLVCLFVVPLSGGVASRRVGALVLGQVAGALLAIAAPGAVAAAAPFPAIVAASTVVFGALYMLVGTRESIVGLLAGAVGLLSGTVLGAALLRDLPLAGAHPLEAVASFSSVVVLAELWLAALLFSGREWLTRRGMPNRVLTYGAGAFVVHTALHHMVDAGVVAGGEPPFGSHAVPVVVLGWALVVIVMAVAVRGAGSASANGQEKVGS